ncbi:hypothetical protein L1987_77210 [Smallanthus sonchifolius]|uniref:Uncharacterized protein n=1 Tax=Smallanthus sonchifolius TaxID=185202 RepID=A0ACB8Z8X9_9ASTR|nr:hypothetical protein L1987_77210 [Smallanthus sonchifolius]
MMKAKLVEIEGYLFCSILSITTVRTPQPTHLETLDLSFVRFPIEETLDLEVAVFLSRRCSVEQSCDNKGEITNIREKKIRGGVW